MNLHPFRALHPRPELAAEVASPPYDVISTAEARELAAGKPGSFLHVIRPEITLAEGTSLYDDSVYAAGAAQLQRLITEGTLVADAEQAIWVYQLDMGDITQVGFVGCAEVSAYEDGLVKRHEFTRPVKEDDRTRHVDTMGAQAGPVFLTCRDEAGSLVALQQRLTGVEPDVDIVGYGDVRHRLWRVAGAPGLEAIAAAFETVPAFYIADGHHRAASAARVASKRGGPSDAAWHRFLVVVFPDTQVQILAYNRVAHDLNGLDAAELLAALEPHFEVGPPGAPADPAGRHAFGLYLDGTWRQLRAREATVDESDPIARLDVAILQDRVLGPLLGMDDPRASDRVDFVGGIRGTDELARRVDARGTGCAFAMWPTGIDELLDVADAGQVMPPKSTWFEPKLASGLLVHLLG